MPLPDNQPPRQILAAGRHLQLVSSDGWEYAERIGATGVVAIVAVHGDRLILTEQYRKPVAARVIDLPAGLAGDLPDEREEAFERAAQRELEEETGFHAVRWKQIAVCATSPGMTSETITVYLATDVSRVGVGGGDESEEITVHEVPLAAIGDWLEEKTSDGMLIDPKVYLGLHFVNSMNSSSSG